MIPHHCSLKASGNAANALSTSQYVFAALFLLSASIGVGLQLLGGYLVRAGTLPESYELTQIWINASNLFKVVLAFERELVVDSGNALINAANLLLYSAVIASLGISFPQWTIEVSIFFAGSIAVVGAAIRLAIGQMVSKRSRQQNLYQALIDQGDVLQAKDLLTRHPSLGSWNELTLLGKISELLKQVVYTAKWYWPREVKQ